MQYICSQKRTVLLTIQLEKAAELCTICVLYSRVRSITTNVLHNSQSERAVILPLHFD